MMSDTCGCVLIWGAPSFDILEQQEDVWFDKEIGEPWAGSNRVLAYSLVILFMSNERKNNF